MASRTSNQARTKGVDAGMNILSIVTAELQTANVTYFQRKIQSSGFSISGWLAAPINPDKSSSVVLLDLLRVRQISLQKIFV